MSSSVIHLKKQKELLIMCANKKMPLAGNQFVRLRWVHWARVWVTHSQRSIPQTFDAACVWGNFSAAPANNWATSRKICIWKRCRFKEHTNTSSRMLQRYIATHHLWLACHLLCTQEFKKLYLNFVFILIYFSHSNHCNYVHKHFFGFKIKRILFFGVIRNNLEIILDREAL